MQIEARAGESASQSSLNERIGQFYDASSALWEQVWGEHMHHGHYGRDGSEKKSRYQAQLDLIDELLSWAGVSRSRSVVDVGCGIGGSSLELAQRFGAAVTGLTLSPYQALRARQRAREQMPARDDIRFEVVDALESGLPAGSADLVWSCESAEHMPDKRAMFEEFARLLEPGGRVAMATWCHRETSDGAGGLSAEEERLLEQICNVYNLPPWVSESELAEAARQAGLEAVETEDWSEAVAPFWGEVLRSAISPSSLVGLARAGLTTVRAAWAVRFMQAGFRRGLVRFVVLRARRP